MTPPVRIAHLGLGAFARSHQAWCTAHATDAGEWGIAGFTGRSTELVRALRAQHGRYTLIERRPDGDHAEFVDSIVAAHAGTDQDTWLKTIASPEVAVVTLTVTEAGYDTGSSVPARLVAGLRARKAAGAAAVALVSCDNLPGNGTVLKRAVDRAAAGEPELAGWIAENVSFVSTVVDRITPATTDDDRAAARELTGWADACPVVTEPFSEWVLAGAFPAGRPHWEHAGARFADDVEVFERRKLWLLNGAHSLLAYTGATRGHTTVADAVTDQVCARWVDEWWDAAQRHLELPADEVTTYRAALTERFANPRMRHRLSQIGMDGSRKLPVRIVPVLRAELAAGREPAGPARILAGWIRHLRGETSEVIDPSAAELTAAARGPAAAAVRSVLSLVDQDLARDDTLVRLVIELMKE